MSGRVMVGREVRVKSGVREYVLTPDSHGWLSSIKVITEVDKPEKFSATVEPQGNVLNVVIDGDQELKEQLVGEFQKLESLLAFATEGALGSISWDEPKEEFLAETEEEKKRIRLYGVQLSGRYAQPTARLDGDEFAEIIGSKEHFVSLVIPMAFWREGMNEFHSGRYINAFYNFYFVLEDLYGEGKTKNNDIRAAFRQSEEFGSFVKWMLEDNVGRQHMVNIQRFCSEEHIAYDVSGVIDLLVRVRGNLHHYSGRSSKHTGTPFRQEDFKSMAFLTMGLAVRAVLQREVEINRARGLGKAEA